MCARSALSAGCSPVPAQPEVSMPTPGLCPGSESSGRKGAGLLLITRWPGLSGVRALETCPRQFTISRARAGGAWGPSPEFMGHRGLELSPYTLPGTVSQFNHFQPASLASHSSLELLPLISVGFLKSRNLPILPADQYAFYTYSNRGDEDPAGGVGSKRLRRDRPLSLQAGHLRLPVEKHA